ncbi:LysR family transcriptional regulator [Mesorhizobium sp. B2-5-13]|nr:LysR family transcriptional regulator [Mesorhizobium sp. B2-5-13]TPM05313.1 LysR family transcriptional regulator [Mesorhizobium sp. B2-3-11]
MDRMEAIRLFVRVVESGSFSAVARSLGVGQPAVSKQVAALEAHLGAQLLQRTSRSLTLTEAGRDFYESGVRLLGDLEAAESRVGRGRVAPSGLVRATVVPVFGRIYVVPRLEQFFARYPDVSVELVVADRMMNLIENGIDLAVHNGDLSDSSLIAKRIAQTPVVTVATPAYLEAHGEPAIPAELEQHSCIIYAPQGSSRVWGFRDRFGPVMHNPKCAFRTNDAEQIRAAVLSGIGIAHAPGWLFGAEIASGAVREILTDYAPRPLAITAVRPAGRFLASKVRVFADFLAELFAQEPSLALNRAGTEGVTLSWSSRD